MVEKRSKEKETIKTKNAVIYLIIATIIIVSVSANIVLGLKLKKYRDALENLIEYYIEDYIEDHREETEKNYVEDYNEKLQEDNAEIIDVD